MSAVRSLVSRTHLEQIHTLPVSPGVARLDAEPECPGVRGLSGTQLEIILTGGPNPPPPTPPSVPRPRFSSASWKNYTLAVPVTSILDIKQNAWN